MGVIVLCRRAGASDLSPKIFLSRFRRSLEIESTIDVLNFHRLLKFDEKSAGEFYSIHKGAEYYDRLIKFTTSDRVFAMELEKENAVEAFRVLIGSTDPKKAAPGTIRAKYGTGLPQNAIHASDSPENALKEIALIFG